MGFLSSPKKKVKFIEPKTSVEARKRIEEISKTSPEGIPLQEIAGFSELEQRAFSLAEQFLSDTSGEEATNEAIDLASRIVNQEIDLNTTEIQGIIQEVRKTGDLALNRIGRQLQTRGVVSTSAGRDILARSITETEKATAGALSPLLADFRRQRLGAASLLPNLVAQRAGQTVGRIGIGAAAGEAQRGLQQRILDATFQRKREMFEFGTTGQANIASLLLQSPTTLITGGGPSGLQQLTSNVSDIASLAGTAGKVIGGIGSLSKGPVSAKTATPAPKLPTGTLSANKDLFKGLFLN